MSSLSSIRGFILGGIAAAAGSAALAGAGAGVATVGAALLAAVALPAAALVGLVRAERTLRDAAAICARAAAGDLEARIPGEPGGCAAGLLQRNINALLDVTDAFVREASGSMRAVSEGRHYRKVLLRGLPGALRNAAQDLNRASGLMEAQAGELHACAGRFEVGVGAVVENLSRASSGMRRDAEAMVGMAADASDMAAGIAAATEQTSANVQTVASAAEQLAASVDEIGRQVALSRTISVDAVARAERTDAVVQDLAQVTRQIGDVVQLITAIAQQTNLLALNATIEAARAGEAGRGFAVVATEVKQLATQTAGATEQVSAKLGAIVSATDTTVEAIQVIGRTIAEMSQIGNAIAAAVDEQGAATQEIARNVQQAAVGTQEIARSVAGMKDAAVQTGAAARSVLSGAAELSDEAVRLRREADAFLAQTKAA
ncbi:methyl-accepting chemotaxis protein [Azospirillum sp. A39]|uniref:methyl-accepting chemotaxis protein n=1 Tax=Azospirillum sp. A39 TaxID=3462279 RepID=UPI0040461105